MYPGRNTRLTEEILVSADTIRPNADIVILTGTVSITNIIPPFAGFSGMLYLVPIDGNVILFDTGNIALATTVFVNLGRVLVFSVLRNKWYAID